MTTEEGHILIDEAKDQSFEEWYAGSWTRVVRAVAVFCGDATAAQDYSAEAFTRAFERWGGPKPIRDPDAWILVVAMNIARRHAKARRDFPTFAPDEALASEVTETDIDLWRAVSQLSPRTRQAVVLRYIGGLTEADIAREMRIRPGTVAATLHNARQQLLRALQREEG